MCRKCRSDKTSQPSRVTIWLIAILVVGFLSIVATSITVSQELAHENNAVSDIDVRYLRKKLELAQHDLQVALEANRQVPKFYSKLSLLRLESQVEYARKLVEQAGEHTDHDLHDIHLQSVKNDVILAEQTLALAKKGGYLPDHQLKRLELAAQLAHLALERAEQPEIAADPMQHLQWQIDRLRSELLSLQVEFERTRPGQ